MAITKFIGVGENIHCTRIYKVGGKFVVPDGRGGHALQYAAGKETRRLPIPAAFTRTADWQAGKLKHCAAAMWQGMYGDGANQAAGIEYLQNLAREQEEAGASYLDINVDDFSTDLDERVRLIGWAVGVIQGAARIPMSIDSSNEDILRAGLRACDPARGRPMVNSVSLERLKSVEVAAQFKAVVIASAAGERELPSTTAERLANLARLMPALKAAGCEPGAIHVDPLVFPISVDGRNGVNFLEAVAAVRGAFGPDIHVVAGLSNVSFGMPNRKLINQVFTRLAIERGADGGIVDPMQINLQALNRLDPESEGFRLARALLLGEDEFGMAFISAAREGRI